MKKEQCHLHHFPPYINKFWLEGDGHWSVLPPGDVCSCVSVLCRVARLTWGLRAPCPGHQQRGHPRRGGSAPAQLSLIYRSNVNGISCLVACNPLQSSSAAEMVLLHAKVLNHHGGSVGMTLAQSDTHLRPQSHGSFNTTSWELPWVIYGHLFGHFCEVWSFQKEKGTGSRVHKFQTKAKVRKKKMRMK